ncbi:hypothetical protein RFI_29297 [Reticulomyxa filosa]|uniref:Uncharacterized protein n=1 Tax=Reticulomyxa filosa TaxID=46433 RepID=X6M361_RETFI|nr:hypothetical protein RFI_29297 [Reticulomyxa filosa]|eukprot:ETO08091.1 hypothetical protein RFI_29297 [Reticulomyxa filosa]
MKDDQGIINSILLSKTNKYSKQVQELITIDYFSDIWQTMAFDLHWNNRVTYHITNDTWTVYNTFTHKHPPVVHFNGWKFGKMFISLIKLFKVKHNVDITQVSTDVWNSLLIHTDDGDKQIHRFCSL